MIIKNIAKVCRESNSIAIYKAPGKEQWIGDGCAMYAVADLPLVTRDQLCSIFDYSDKVKARICDCKITDTAAKLLTDNYADETYIEELPEEIAFRSNVYKMFTCAGRVFMVKESYLSPLLDISDDTVYYMRYHGDLPVLCVKRGFVTVAIIMPIMLGRDAVREYCTKLHNIIEKLDTQYFPPDADAVPEDQMTMEDMEDEY